MFVNNTKSNLGADAEFLPWDNPDSLVTYDSYLKWLSYFNTVIKPTVYVLCMTTNIFNCLVFRSQGLRDRMNLCLFVLAIIDMTCLSYSMIYTVTMCIRIAKPELGEELYVKELFYAMGVNYGWREASACINVVIAVERCVCVLFPLQANTIMSTRTMGILLVSIVIGMQLAFVTAPAKRYVFPVYDNTTGKTRWTVTSSEPWKNNQDLILYEKVEDTFMMIVFPFFTFTVVSGATIITVVKVRGAMVWRENASSVTSDAQGQHLALTKMLVVVSCLFVICRIPWVAITLARIFYPSFSSSGRQANLYLVLELVAHYFPYTHSSVTFFIYFSQSSRYRSHLRRLCSSSKTFKG